MPTTSPRRRLVLARLLVLVVGFALVGAVVVGLDRFQGWRDCTTVERYDALRDECFFECDDDRECEALRDMVDAELEARFASTATQAEDERRAPSPAAPVGDRYTLATTGSETDGRVYTVTERGLTPRARRSDARLWAAITTLIGTREAERRLASVEVFDDADNDTAASVWPSDVPGRWHLNVNAAYATEDRRELVRTLVHEYGHVLTLSPDQVEPTRTCRRVVLAEGCSRSDSSVDAFYRAFWSDYGLGREDVSELDEDVSAMLWDGDRSAFVSEYATTDITEDLAESFADLVLGPRPDDDVAGDKVRFLAQRPELERVRTRLREGAAALTG